MIHIIDDDKSVREGFSMLFKSADIQCSLYESAEEFLKYFNTGKKELLILDMHMPGISGCNLLEILMEKGLHLPVIVVTAYNDETSEKYAKNYGVIAYLHKPVDSEALLDLIKFNAGILN
jgi:FixJ family two-component response regulator